MKNKKTIRYEIDGIIYKYALPKWWNNIKIDFSNIQFSEDYTISNYCEENYEEEVGNKKTWRKALKAHALYNLNNNELPIYIGHCASAGGEHEYAARIFTELFSLAQFLKHDDNDFLRCYLAYEIGKEYQVIRQYDLAIVWFEKSMKFIHNENSTVRYYADQSKEILGILVKKKVKEGILKIDFKWNKTPKASSSQVKLFRNFCSNEFNSNKIHESIPTFDEEETNKVLDWVEENCDKNYFGLLKNIVAVYIADGEPYPLSEIIHTHLKVSDPTWYEENIILNQEKLTSFYLDNYF